ncbi:MAG: translation elongation factor Ts [Acidobacteriota bacterium]|jgi:elongation factor Ts|nr:translation elongation factor Ts [Acidobacteriota bacterium]NLT34195.1 translation elongation factor Ts [Acidobacteriota bacterium]
MAISADLVKELREKTGVGFMECKNALREANGNVEEAVTILRKRGLASLTKKSGRETKDGLIGSYVHNGKIGVMVEVNCETDFVARNPDFQALVRDIAMHIAASDPRFVSKEDVTEDVLAKERDIYREQAKASGKPEGVLDKIVEGRVAKYYAEACLLEQPFVKEPSVSVRDHIASHIQKIGENIQVRRFVRYKLGE